MAKRKSRVLSKNDFGIPVVVLRVFAIAAVFLLPWAVWLSTSLPSDHLDRQWNLAWSGFDVGLFMSLLMSAYLGFRKSGWLIVAVTISGTLLIIDAWFDCLTARQGSEYLVSMLSAVFAELPLAILAFWVAYRTGKRFFVKSHWR